MKNILRLELFGEDLRQQVKLYRMIFDVNGGAGIFDACIGMPKKSTWVAKISGPDEKYGLKREFLQAKIDYSHANSTGSRGVMAEYILESGYIYEVQEQISWRKTKRYFCRLSESGEIIEIDKETACNAVGAKTR